GATNFALAYHGLDDRALQESLARLYLAACPALGFVAPHCREDPRQQCERPRIGFVSSFFRAHTIGRLFGRLIAGLPGQGFDVRVFSFNPQEDALSGSLAEAVDEFIPLAPDLEAARQRIAEARLDILYFCDLGMEPLTYFLAFSRLAPIQCVSWGHPVTTGIPSLDYFLSSHLTEPEGAGEAYSERLVRLRGFPVCVEAPPRAERARRRANLYICPQSLFKFHPDFDRLIGQVLRLDPKGELLVLEGSHPRWREILGRRWRRTLPGVAERIKFIPRMAREDYLNALAGASVMLDTPHFCGGMTSLEGLANRLPVVTLPGRFLRGRVTAGFLEALDLGECIAESEEEYAETAVRLAGAEGAAKKLRGQISDRAPSLFNNPRDLDENARFFRWALAGGQGSFP
ncbi:MAG: hypothetical protein QGF09_10070, partial [Rhodospirillales bacterium]|nr:hypothetical protein [Rhodospirillales bacterium]